MYSSFVLQVFLQTLAQIFLCQQRRKRQKEMGSESEEVEISRLHLTENNCRIRTISETDTNANTENTLIEEPNNSGVKAILDVLSALKINLSSIDIAVHRILRHKVSVQRDATAMDLKWKWRLVALILDRMFLVLYVFIILISLILLLPRASYWIIFQPIKITFRYQCAILPVYVTL